MPNVSAIIVNYNAGTELNKAVNSLLCSDSVTRIIVIDNNSRDNSMKDIETLAASNSRIVCIRNNKKSGFCQGL